jgi:hypothetical protein
VRQAEEAWQKKDKMLFSSAVQSFGDGLAALGLLAPASLPALAEARALPGVLAAKGCGAMGADVLLLLQEAGAPPPEAWREQHSLAEALCLGI